MSARTAVRTPRSRRSRTQRFFVALTRGDAGRSVAEVEGCSRLHRIAELERENYGEVLSPDARDHDLACIRNLLTVEYR